MNPLKNSFFATVLILVIWVIRRLTLNRLPKNTFCILWICAALRLVIPFSIPSRFSIYNLVLNPLMQQPTSEVPTYQMMAQMKSAPQVTPLTLIWLAGVLVLAAILLVSYIRSMVIFRRAVPVESLPEGSPKFLRHVRIKKSSRITCPLTYGIFRPVILLPDTTDWEDTAALSYVLTHEYTHIRRWDCLTKLLMAAALCLHWFNPAVWLLCWFAGRDMELACDEMVIRTLGEENRFSYARTLTEQGRREQGIFLPVSTFGGTTVKERVDAILNPCRQSWVILVISIVLVIVTLVVFDTGAKAPKYLTSAEIEAQPDYSDWSSVCPDDARLCNIVSTVDGNSPDGDQSPVNDVTVWASWQMNNGAMLGTGCTFECASDGSVILPTGQASIPIDEFSNSRFQNDEEFIDSFSPEYRQAAADLLHYFAEFCANYSSEDVLSDPSICTMLTSKADS